MVEELTNLYHCRIDLRRIGSAGMAEWQDILQCGLSRGHRLGVSCPLLLVQAGH